jgi:hypothetical protein
VPQHLLRHLQQRRARVGLAAHRHQAAAAGIDFLQNSVSVDNFSDKFLPFEFRPKFHPKTADNCICDNFGQNYYV